MNRWWAWSSLGVWALAAAGAVASPADAWRERRAQRAAESDARAGWAEGTDDQRMGAALALPPGTQWQRDLAYGSDPRQRMDVYLPAQARGPVLLLVHGGGWRHGDKAHGRLLNHKLAHWLGQGVVVVSANYRMLPDAPPDVQTRDVAQALAYAQQQAPTWGADARRFVLMGHSAGAHLVALLAAAPGTLPGLGAAPVLGVVLLDSGAVDVVQTMQARHPALFDAAFGPDPAYWRAVSPLHQLQAGAAPQLVVCSSQRRTACAHAHAYASHGAQQGLRMQVLPQALSHADTNAQLGLPGAYTQAVDAFLHSLPGWGRP